MRPLGQWITLYLFTWLYLLRLVFHDLTRIRIISIVRVITVVNHKYYGFNKHRPQMLGRGNKANQTGSPYMGNDVGQSTVSARTVSDVSVNRSPGETKGAPCNPLGRFLMYYRDVQLEELLCLEILAHIKVW